MLQLNNPGQTLEQRLNPASQLWYEIIDRVFQSLRVSAIGIVQSFDPVAGTVVVQIATRELVRQNTADAGVISLATTAEALPLLTDVPVQWAQGGGWNLTFPIQPGDECLLLFNDASLDAWWTQGAATDQVNPISNRRHSLSDAVAIFGLRSTPRKLSSYATASAQLRNDDGSVVVDLSPTQITIQALSGKVVVNANEADVFAATVSVVATGTATVQGVTVNINGGTNVSIAGGSVTIGNGTTIDSRVFLNHHHSGVSTGGGVSGPVV